MALDNYANAVTLQIGSTIAGNLNMGTSMATTLTLSDNGTGGSQTYSAAVSGTTSFAGTLIKAGGGTWTLDRTLSPTQGTNVTAGTLVVNASLSGAGAVTVAGAVDVKNNGTFSPGQFGAGKLTLNSNLICTGVATAGFTLAGTGNTQALVGGQIDLGNATTLSLTLSAGFVPTQGMKFYLLDESGTTPEINGTFANAPMTGSQFTQNGVIYQINYADHDPADTSNALLNDVSVTIVTVPEPSTWMLLVLGFTGLGVAALRCRGYSA